jgi:hypothetical protein
MANTIAKTVSSTVPGNRAAGVAGDAEVQLERPPEEAQVLLPQGLVQPEDPVVLGDLGGGGAFPQCGDGGPSGEGPQPGEQQDRQPQQDRDQLEEPPDDESEHVLGSALLDRRPCRRRRAPPPTRSYD